MASARGSSFVILKETDIDKSSIQGTRIHEGLRILIESAMILSEYTFNEVAIEKEFILKMYEEPLRINKLGILLEILKNKKFILSKKK